jgi:hypothetical protein
MPRFLYSMRSSPAYALCGLPQAVHGIPVAVYETAFEQLYQSGNQGPRAGLNFFIRTPLTAALVFSILHGCAYKPRDSIVEPGLKPASSVASPLAVAQQMTNAPSMRARSAIMIDAQNGKTLYGKNADERLPVASTQELLTAMEVIAEGELEQDVQVTIWDQNSSHPQSSASSQEQANAAEGS